MKTQITDTLPAKLYVEKLSRDKFGAANSNWMSFNCLERAFLENHEEKREDYEKFMKQESKVWGSLFNESFKKHSLYCFAMTVAK